MLEASAPICQSCGMPMAAKEHFGTNSDDSPNRDYCCFCYKEGRLTDDLDFEGKISDNLSFHDENRFADGRRVTRGEEELRLRLLLPTLRRWKNHVHTHENYYRSVNTAVEYIQGRLNAPPALNEIAREAGLSMFHFHRIFRAVIGETPDEYIRRLRIERAAFLLQTTDKPVGEIAFETQYDTASFSKIFRKQFGMTPSAFRKQPIPLSAPLHSPLVPLEKPEIVKTVPFSVNYVRVTDPFGTPGAFIHAWQVLTELTGVNGIPDENQRYYLFARDNSLFTDTARYRAYACVRLPEPAKPKRRLGRMKIEGGLFAVFTYIGPYTQMEQVFCTIYRHWLPNSHYRLRDCSAFERFLNSPQNTPAEKLVTEIYIPIDPV